MGYITVLACFQMSGKLIIIVITESVNSAPLVIKNKIKNNSKVLGQRVF